MKAIMFMMLLLVAVCAFVGVYFLVTGSFAPSVLFLLVGSLGMFIYEYIERKEREDICNQIMYDVE